MEVTVLLYLFALVDSLWTLHESGLALHVSGTQAVHKVLLQVVVLQIVSGFVMNSRSVTFSLILSHYFV